MNRALSSLKGEVVLQLLSIGGASLTASLQIQTKALTESGGFFLQLN